MSKTIEGVIVSLSENEAWQGNLTDEERRLCLEWAERRLADALCREAVFVSGILSTVNWLMRNPAVDRGEVIRAFFGG